MLLAAAGTGLLGTWSAATPYAALLSGLLAWGIGIALLTPAVVAAAAAWVLVTGAERPVREHSRTGRR